MKNYYSTDKAPSAPKFLSQAIESNGFVFVSGQVHVKPDGELVSGSTQEKMEQIMDNISNILAEAKLSMDSIVKAVIYTTEMSQMAEINEVYPSYFTEPYPVREAVCVKELPLEATIEISVVAAR